jgi:hypothetical protein
MHMVVHFALLVTTLLIVAYFLFLTASKAGGLTSAFGRLLGLWLLLLAAIIVGGVVTAHLNGGKPYGMDFPMGHHHDGMHDRGPPDAPPPPAAPETVPAPETAPAAPATPAKP